MGSLSFCVTSGQLLQRSMRLPNYAPCFIESAVVHIFRKAEKLCVCNSTKGIVAILQISQKSVLPEMFRSTYEAITKGNKMWNELDAPGGALYSWNPESTYVHEPPFFKTMTRTPPGIHGVKDAYVLLNFGDSITTDHISPAGSIHKDSPAARFLMSRGVERKDFNSYGSRRGNDEIMARGTFANIRIVNKFLDGEVGPKTIHVPSGEKMYIYDAAMVNSQPVPEVYVS